MPLALRVLGQQLQRLMALKRQLLVSVHPACASNLRGLLADPSLLQASFELVDHMLVLEVLLCDHHEHGLGDPHPAVQRAKRELLPVMNRPNRREPIRPPPIRVTMASDHAHHSTLWHNTLGAVTIQCMLSRLLSTSQPPPEQCDVGPLARAQDLSPLCSPSGLPASAFMTHLAPGPGLLITSLLTFLLLLLLLHLLLLLLLECRVGRA